MKILFTSAAGDSSGYAEASRNYICALAQLEGVELSCRIVSFESWNTDIGQEYKDIINPLINKQMVPDVQIIHLTPENFPKYRIDGIKNIGYTVWETSKLPPNWVGLCNQMDEIWVPCEWNVKVFQESGVTVPIVCVPHTFNPSSFQGNRVERDFCIPQNRFNFYSIFQWSARKNPEGLLQAYYSEFNPDEDVCLVLKTYDRNNSINDKEKVKRYIQGIKDRMWLPAFPPVVLLHESLSRDEILALHDQGDCFVLPHRAEGWGIPHFEAMASGNPVISTGYSGNLEFMNEENSFLIQTNETPCFGMSRPTYNGKMMWGEPNLDSLMKQMRSVFEGARPAVAPESVLDRFSWQQIGQRMAGRLGI